MQEKEKAKRLQSEPDEEGWVTIGKGGRKPGASKVEAAELLERKKKKKQKVALIFKTMSVRKMMKRSNLRGGLIGSHQDKSTGRMPHQWVWVLVLKGLPNLPPLNRFLKLHYYEDRGEIRNH